MKKLKNSILLLLTMALIVTATVNLSPVYAISALKVLPANIVTAPTPGTTFTVDVYVDDVYRLVSFEFKLVYLPTILNVLDETKITLGAFFGGPSTIGLPPGGPSIVWYNEVDNGLGYVWYAVSFGTSSPYFLNGKSGSGILATIEFTVVGEGGTILDLVETDLRNPAAEGIAHEVSYATYTNVPGAPTASFIADPTIVEIKQKVRFDASASGDPDGYDLVSYYWEFGDGTSEPGLDAHGDPTPLTDHAYSDPGEYRVKLTVTDISGAQGMAATLIRVNPPSTPKAVITELEPNLRNIKKSGAEYGINFFSYNYFYVYVQSLCNGPMWVKVSFTITINGQPADQFDDDGDGFPVSYFETTPYPFDEGTYLYIHKFNTQYEYINGVAQYETDEVEGNYIVTVQVWYSADGYNYTPGNIRSFKFKVTP